MCIRDSYNGARTLDVCEGRVRFRVLGGSGGGGTGGFSWSAFGAGMATNATILVNIYFLPSKLYGSSKSRFLAKNQL